MFFLLKAVDDTDVQAAVGGQRGAIIVVLNDGEEQAELPYLEREVSFA